MKCDYIILPDAEPEAPPPLIRLVDGYIVQRRKRRALAPSDRGRERGPIDGRALLVLPPHATTLHWIACPEMTVKQGARRPASWRLEASDGGRRGLHAAVMPATVPEESHVVAVTSESAMAHWIDWCAERGVPNAIIVPARSCCHRPGQGLRAWAGGAENAKSRAAWIPLDARANRRLRLVMGREPDHRHE